ncbi:MAG TPA: hypothetical protein DEA08_08285 [Planctomycetes bacterium]|nr:hypothetical protein [Planctomycetota bacterium]
MPAPDPTRAPLRGVAILAQDVDILGGSERQTRLIAERLAKRGIHVILLTSNGRGALGRPKGAWRERRRGVTVYRLPLVGFEAAASAVLAGERFDVLYAIGVMMGSFAGRLSRVFEAPVVVKLACSGAYGDVAALEALGARARAGALRDLSEATIVCLSEELREEADEIGLGARRCKIPNGVAPPPPGEPVFPLGEGGPPTVLFLGRLTEQKGVDVLLDAFARVEPESSEDAPALLLAGEGPAREELEAQADRLGIAERVVFLGRRADVWGLLRGATLCCLPSRGEGISNALLEALVAGCPVVASNIPANAEVLEGEAGLLAQPEDHEDLAAQLTRLLSDPELRERLSKAGQERIAERYALDVVASSYEELFLELPRKPRPALGELGPRFLGARAASARRVLGRLLPGA